jgi:hypothetical protein
MEKQLLLACSCQYVNGASVAEVVTAHLASGVRTLRISVNAESRSS